MTPFAENLLSIIDSVPGATERDQFKYWLENAECIQIKSTASKTLSLIVDTATHSIESNLDFAQLPNKYFWIEWYANSVDDKSTFDGRRQPEKIGALLAPFTDTQDEFLALISWQFADGNVDYSHALLSWSQLDIIEHAVNARLYYSKTSEEVISRMMSLCYTSVPDGFIDEIDIIIESDELEVDNQSVHKEAHENASAEFISLMAALLFLQTDKSCVLTEQKSDTQKSYYSAEYVEKKRTWWRDRGVKFYRSQKKSQTFLDIT